MSSDVVAMPAGLPDDAGPPGDPGRLVIDGMAPASIVSPRDEAEVAETVAHARAAGKAIIAVGGATQLGTGNVPGRYDVALLTGAMYQVVAHEPADMTVTVQPGVTLASLQRLLASHGQWLPLDPPASVAATIGGVLATNASGPARHAYGTARDWLIGARAVLGTGQAVKSGGRVVKNVTGFDLHKLHIGALGTLGILTEATFKLAPLPRQSRTVLARMRSAAEGAALIADAQRGGLALTGAELLSPAAAQAIAGGQRCTALLRVAGGEAAAERTLRELGRAADGGLDEAEDATWDRWSDAMRRGSLRAIVSVRPSEVGGCVEALAALDGEPTISATVSAGLIRVAVDVADDAAPGALAAIHAAAASCEGTVTVMAAPSAFKRSIDVFGPPRADLAIMRRLKQEYDPDRVLAPGRFYGRL